MKLFGKENIHIFDSNFKTMKTFFTILFLLPFISFTQIEISNQQWLLGGNAADNIAGVEDCGDGYLIYSYSESPISGEKTVANFGQSDYWLVKTDYQHNILWQKVYGGNDWENANKLLKINDQRYLLAGTSSSNASGSCLTNSYGITDMWLVFIDSSGNEIWQSRFGGSSNEFLTDALYKDGFIYLFGYSSSPSDGNKDAVKKGTNDIWVVKIDTLGNKVWDKSLGGGEIDQAPRAEFIGNQIVFSSFNYTLTGTGDSLDINEPSYGLGDIWVVKCDTALNILNQKRLGGSDEEFLPDLILFNGTIIVTCQSSSNDGNKSIPTINPSGGNDLWLVQLDDNLSILDQKLFGGFKTEQGALYAVSLSNGDLLLPIVSASNDDGTKEMPNFYPNPPQFPYYDIWFVCLDSNLDEKWQLAYGGTANDYVRKIIEKPNNTLAVFGTSNSLLSGNKTVDRHDQFNDGWIIQIETTLDIPETNDARFKIFPNPVENILYMNFENQEKKSIFIYSSNGFILDSFEISESEFQIDINAYSSGVYFLRISEKGNHFITKIVKN